MALGAVKEENDRGAQRFKRLDQQHASLATERTAERCLRRSFHWRAQRRAQPVARGPEPTAGAGGGWLGSRSSSVEQHFSVKELSELWEFSERTVRRLIEQEPGVIRIHQSSRGKRSYRRVQVPASIAERIYRKITRR